MLTDKKFNTYRTWLQSMKTRLNAHVAQLRDESSQAMGEDARASFTSEPGDVADRASEQSSVAVAIGVAENEAYLRTEIESALERMDAGTYAICQDCGAAIPARRLNAVPYARCCIRCERQIEQGP
jgi:RNA polymerase-binding protein DksA